MAGSFVRVNGERSGWVGGRRWRNDYDRFFAGIHLIFKRKAKSQRPISLGNLEIPFLRTRQKARLGVSRRSWIYPTPTLPGLIKKEVYILLSCSLSLCIIRSFLSRCYLAFKIWISFTLRSEWLDLYRSLRDLILKKFYENLI